MNFPIDWLPIKISEIAIKGDQRKPDNSETFTYVDIGSIDRERKVISSPQELDGENAPSRARKCINTGDVLVSLTRPNLNAVALVGEEYDNQIASTGFEVIKPILVDSRFIFSLVRTKHFIDNISGATQGALYPAAKSSDVQGYQLGLPPLAEQKVIAKKLDKLLAKVDSIKARLDAVPDTLKRFRQSVLAAAVSGKLTEEWRKSNSMDGLSTLPVRELLDSLDQGWSPKCINTPAESNNWGVIKTSSVQSGYFVSEENKALPENLEPRPNLSLMSGDILITRAGPRVRCGVTCLVEHSYPQLMICDKIYRLRVNKDKILPEFLNWCFNSPQYLKEIEGMKTGSSDSGMNMTQKKLKELELRVPPLLEQTEIVRRVEKLFAYADKVEAEVNVAKERVNKLTQSILAKAFRGELTAKWREQNPDLISGENSAEALLEKIKAEREKLKPKKKTRTRKNSKEG